jgi:type I restriction enzyme, R subunit
MNYYEQFQRLIDEYNSGATNAEQFFAQLVSFAQNLTQEEQRGIAENLSEEELALFDILTRPDMKLSREEKKQVKGWRRNCWIRSKPSAWSWTGARNSRHAPRFN